MNINEVRCKDIVRVADGVLCFVGYLYDTGDKCKRPWKWIAYDGFEFNLGEELTAEMVEEAAVNVAEYEYSISKREAQEIWDMLEPEPISLESINKETKTGFYYIV